MHVHRRAHTRNLSFFHSFLPFSLKHNNQTAKCSNYLQVHFDVVIHSIIRLFSFGFENSWKIRDERYYYRSKKNWKCNMKINWILVFDFGFLFFFFFSLACFHVHVNAGFCMHIHTRTNIRTHIHTYRVFSLSFYLSLLNANTLWLTLSFHCYNNRHTRIHANSNEIMIRKIHKCENANKRKFYTQKVCMAYNLVFNVSNREYSAQGYTKLLKAIWLNQATITYVWLVKSNKEEEEKTQAHTHTHTQSGSRSSSSSTCNLFNS